MAKHLSPSEVTLLTRAAHEVNRTWNMTINQPVDPPWEELDEGKKVIARQAVINVVTHDYTPEQTHNQWMAAKRAQGWNYGEVKDESKKLHPCLVEYKDLPLEQRVKDELWVTTVKNVASHYWKLPQG